VGVILDSSVLIASERRGASVSDVLERVQAVEGETVSALSVVSAVELTHGIYRARTDADRQRREAFIEELYQAVVVYPLTLEIARMAGRIHGEQMAQGVSIDFQDLLIGVTALHLGYSIATVNVRHFRLIPQLNVIQL
jgi:tRNA(fMet)-specific endonuclease VapC